MSTLRLSAYDSFVKPADWPPVTVDFLFSPGFDRLPVAQYLRRVFNGHARLRGVMRGSGFGSKWLAGGAPNRACRKNRLAHDSSDRSVFKLRAGFGPDTALFGLGGRIVCAVFRAAGIFDFRIEALESIALACFCQHELQKAPAEKPSRYIGRIGSGYPAGCRSSV